MNILGITPSNPNTGRTPEELYLLKLEELGHKVIILENPETIPTGVDVIAAISEESYEKAHMLSKIHNIPFYAHMNWIPPWRVFRDDGVNWGLDTVHKQLSYSEKIALVRMYSTQCFHWMNADVKSLSAKCFKQLINEFIGKNILSHIIYKGHDTDKIIKFLDKTELTKREEITCVAKFVPYNRIHHIIEALNKIKFKGVLNLVGSGPEKKLYESIKEDIVINYVDDKYKLECIARSKVCVVMWDDVVPAESLFLDTPCVTYDSPFMKELYSDTLVYAENNNIDDLAEKISHTLQLKDIDRNELTSKGVNDIEHGKINARSLKYAVNKLELLLQEAIEKRGMNNE